jgi:hypothetical protein
VITLVRSGHVRRGEGIGFLVAWAAPLQLNPKDRGEDAGGAQ